MNVILIEAHELTDDGTAVLTDRRAEHIRKILRARPGDRLRVGLLGGLLGSGELLSLTPLRLRCVFDQPPPARPRIHLLLGMPRPITLKRLLRQAAELGLESIELLRTARTEKSYFDSPVLGKLEQYTRQGLEQAGGTRLPSIGVSLRFRPFVEDVLPGRIAANDRALLAVVGAGKPLKSLELAGSQDLHLAIGPDGGWLPFEAELLAQAGFEGVSLGPRVFRTDTALTWAVAQLVCCRRQHPKIAKE